MDAAHRAFLFPATVAFPERLQDPRLKEDFGPQIYDEVQSSFRNFPGLSYFSVTDQEMRWAKASLGQWIEANVTMGMGTDSGTPMNFHTEALWREIKARLSRTQSEPQWLSPGQRRSRRRMYRMLIAQLLRDELGVHRR